MYLQGSLRAEFTPVAVIEGFHGLVVIEDIAIREQEDRVLGIGKPPSDEGPQVMYICIRWHVKTNLDLVYLLEPFPRIVRGKLFS